MIINKSFINSETQTNFSDEDGNEITKIWNANKAADDNPTNFVDQIKKVAELAVQQTGFVYEETTGLYYDYNTGYYYDAVNIFSFFSSIILNINNAALILKICFSNI